MSLQKFHSIRSTVRRYAMRPTADGQGTQSTYAGGIAFHAEVFLDMAALQCLASRAALNKGGKAKAGPVVVKITTRHDVA